MKNQNWLRNLSAGLLCSAALCLPNVQAGDAAFVDVLGFSPSGGYFAFQQSGEQDGSGFGYSDLFFLDVEQGSWAAKPERYLTSDEEIMAAEESGNWDSVSGEAIARKVRMRAMPTLRKFDLTSANKGKTLLEDFAQPKPGDFPNCSRKSFQATAGKLNAEVEVKATPIPGSDNNFGEPLKLLEVTLRHANGKLQLLHKDMRLPLQRKMAYDYDVSAVYLGGPSGSDLAIVVGYLEPSFEGPDKRYLAITKDLSSNLARSSRTKLSTKASSISGGRYIKYGEVKVNTSLNVRSGPGTEYDIIGALFADNGVYIVNQNVPGWYEIEFTEHTGWISKKYVKLRSLSAVCIAETSLNVRRSPSLSGKILGALRGGQQVDVSGEFYAENGSGRLWFEIEWRGRKAWASAKYIEVHEFDC